MRGVSHKATQVRRLLPIPNKIWTNYDLLGTLVRRDLAARYQGSLLGNLWSLVNQLSQLLIYTYVFSIVLKVKLSIQGLPANENISFGLWLFAGLLPWIAFTTGLIQATSSVITQPNLVKKVVFPLTLLPLVPIFSAFIESSLGLMALIVAIAITSHLLHPTLALLPFLWIPQLLFTTGLGYLFAGLTVFVRDIPQTLGVMINIWFYLTPIVYPITSIPQPWQKFIFYLNPMATIAELYREIVLTGEILHWREWGVIYLISTCVFIGGFWCYKRLRPAFADVL
ncbi:ABC transporter permease [Calothrix sp. 336/3]|uniref:ABC transporter permease n=1 Tax=Calothrix sp. 336/3 TaxID=1337936 RepID=UPI0004E2D43F|nr:ABC transporter permease [Calothrix sp. 336/3]AKG24578.1 ABC transporter permease [Calothrix sp. 336/3]